MITAKTFKHLRDRFSEKVVKKLHEIKPSIEVNEFGNYSVVGSGKVYTVVIGLNHERQHFIACTCYGSLHGNGCYHGLIAFMKHSYLLKKKRAEMALDEPKSDIQEFSKVPYFKGGNEKPIEKVGKVRI